METTDFIEHINSKEDFLKFVGLLLNDFNERKHEWENVDLGRFLEAMKSFVGDMNEHSLNKIDMTPSWKLFAEILQSATIYE